LGALIASVAAILPAFLLMIIFAMFYDQLSDIVVFQKILVGIRIAITLLIIKVGVGLLIKQKYNLTQYIIATIVFVLSVIFPSFSSLIIIFAVAFLFLLFFAIFKRPLGGEREKC
jgi:chromate transport protein ChrA